MTALDAIRRRAGDFRPEIGLVLGSGLNPIAERIEAVAGLDYGEIPGFPVATAPSHAGRLVLGSLAGRRVACLQGRVHLYEGVAAGRLALPVRTLAGLGCRTLVVTNAAGSLDRQMPPGAVMAIADHINMSGANPLAATHKEAHGPRFVPMNDAYDPELRRVAHAAADEAGIALHEGVYLGVLGPSFETPAEIRAFRLLGADAVGMSTVAEVIVARQAGMRVLGLSLVTNMAAGLGDTAPTAEEVTGTAALAADGVARLLVGILARLP